ncbi:MAG: beta-N-acetylhexosaminidase [Alphaproteobacteria bacterium]|nr:beta-N-acetylhexosaminidase [Alphaproteobacteria bacterium]
MSGPDQKPARALILGCAGSKLGEEERRFFRDANPLGFILFERNCQDPAQLRALVADLRAAIGREDAPVLIDQEGGRVCRLRPPYWRAAPSAARFGQLAERKPEAALEAAWLNARLLAGELRALGVTVDCVPVLDLPVAGADPVIGDRAFGGDAERTASLGRAVCEGLLAGGVLPVLKHIPGHGRAHADSHRALPVVETPAAELEATDFRPFRLLSEMPLAMTAHIVYTALDPQRPATLSKTVIEEAIRKRIGFDGALMTDDISMSALEGALADRARAALAAGCDAILHCNGRLEEMTALAGAVGPLPNAAHDRFSRAEALRGRAEQDADMAGLAARLAELLEAAP